VITDNVPEPSVIIKALTGFPVLSTFALSADVRVLTAVDNVDALALRMNLIFIPFSFAMIEISFSCGSGIRL
jgi:hypothetical protein